MNLCGFERECEVGISSGVRAVWGGLRAVVPLVVILRVIAVGSPTSPTIPWDESLAVNQAWSL